LRNLVLHVLVGLLLVLVDDFLAHFLFKELPLLVLLQLTTLVRFKFLVALLEHSLLLRKSVLRDEHLSLQLLLLTHCTDFESPIGLRTKKVAGNIVENPVGVVDSEAHLGVRPLLCRLGHIFFLEYFVLALAKRRNCQNQPSFIRVVFLNRVDSRRRET